MGELPGKSIIRGIMIYMFIGFVAAFVLGFSVCGMICKYSHSEIETPND